MQVRSMADFNAPNSGTCVFVGNIPYDVSEKQLEEMFASCGPIVSFRLVNDKETGRSKGYGFCDYQDYASAERCTRTLNGVEINGRTLRIDFSESETKVPQRPSQRNSNSGTGAPSGAPGGVAMGMGSAQSAAGVLEMMIGAQPRADGQQADPITSTLAGLSKSQLLELMQQLNQLIRTNQQQARGIHPQQQVQPPMDPSQQQALLQQVRSGRRISDVDSLQQLNQVLRMVFLRRL